MLDKIRNLGPGLASLCVLLLLLGLIGTGLRLYTHQQVSRPGVDEGEYLHMLERVRSGGGLAAYPPIVQDYVRMQEEPRGAKVVPPTRCLYPLLTSVWCRITAGRPFKMMQQLATFASLLTLVVSTVLAWRLGGASGALCMFTLMATAPLEVESAHHTLVDGFLPGWTVLSMWLFWECWRQPRHRGWLAAYALSVTAMLLVKETSVLTVAALALCLLGGRWLGLESDPPSRRKVWWATLIGVALATILLSALCGGPGWLFRVVKIDLFKPLSDYSHQHQDGPWFGYAIALLLLNPLLAWLLAAALLGSAWKSAAGRYCSTLLLVAIVPLSLLQYQLLPRVLSFLDFPLLWLGYAQLLWMTRKLAPHRARLLTLAGVAALAAVGLRHYWLFFERDGIYDPILSSLLSSLRIYK